MERLYCQGVVAIAMGITHPGRDGKPVVNGGYVVQMYRTHKIAPKHRSPYGKRELLGFNARGVSIAFGWDPNHAKRVLELAAEVAALRSALDKPTVTAAMQRCLDEITGGK